MRNLSLNPAAKQKSTTPPLLSLSIQPLDHFHPTSLPSSSSRKRILMPMLSSFGHTSRLSLSLVVVSQLLLLLSVFLPLFLIHPSFSHPVDCEVRTVLPPVLPILSPLSRSLLVLASFYLASSEVLTMMPSQNQNHRLVHCHYSST